jgi:hypothetical protein
VGTVGTVGAVGVVGAYVRMYVCTHLRMYVCMYVRMYASTYVRMHVCTLHTLRTIRTIRTIRYAITAVLFRVGTNPTLGNNIFGNFLLTTTNSLIVIEPDLLLFACFIIVSALRLTEAIESIWLPFSISSTSACAT